MKRIFFLMVLFLFFGIFLNAQTEYRAPLNARYSPNMTEREMYDVTFLQKMSKEDWVRFSNDPRFDADRVTRIKTEWKQNHKPIHAMQKSLQSSGESLCTWIEPTSDYEHPNTIQWPGSPGNSTDNYSDPINLGWNFNYFGQNFNQVVLTTKGTIVMGNAGYIDFTPSAFPDPLASESNQQYDHIAGYWTDFDFGATGELYYLVTPEALYVNYIDVGYWPNQSDKSNSFQMIITPDGSDVIGGGNNVQFTYYDMQFCNSQISGASGGCEATTNLANVGCDRPSGTQHYAFGRFNLCNSTQYNGPYGVTAPLQDGIDWLDGRVIEFNTSITNFNLNQPPVVVGEACDTITMCIGETFNFDLAFTSPEATQTTSISYAQSSSGFTATSTSGNAAIMNSAQFVASAANVGDNTVTITATDNGIPVATTVITYVFQVENTIPPAIEITGVTAICAGGETLLTASEGFESYTWSNGYTGPAAEITSQGLITVVGHFGNCSSVASVNIDVTPYFIPELVGGNDPIEMCPGQDTTICVIDDNYASFEWYIYPGYDGEFVAGSVQDEACTQVTGNVNGNYAILVTDENGCEGLNIKLVTITESFVCASNDNNNGGHCDGLDPVEFCGFSNPADDNLVVYGLSTNQNGWQGSYINIYIYPAEGGPPEEYFMTTFGPLTINDDIIIGAGDSIAIEYFANGNNFAGNSIWVINCGQNSPTIIPAPLTDGVVWSALSTCVSVPLVGQWTVTGPSGWNLTSTTLMNSIFTPTQYGTYNLCFNDPACNVNHCYDLEYTLPPTITLNPGLNLLLCDDETSSVNANVYDAASTGAVTWSGQGVAAANDGLSADVGPYNNYVTTTVTATITNGCGSASDSFTVNYQPNVPEPSLNDQYLCNGASIVLDPIPNNQDNPNLEYDWTGTATSPTLTVNQIGTYSVTVSNDCDESNEATAVIEAVFAANVTSQPNDNILECNSGQVTLNVVYGNPAEYTISWTGPVTSSTNSVVANQDGNYCWEVTDIYNCNTVVQGCSQVNISAVPNASSGSSDLLALCPRECKPIDLVATGENQTYSWSTSCSGYQISSSSASIEYCADNVPVECLGAPITITGTVTNACGSDNATWSVQSNACEVTVYNIITPNGDSKNDVFEIKGLENYTNAELTIFNRWGNAVYESKNYGNNWNAADIADGTYWYILKLPYGLKTEYKGFFTILR